MIRGGWIREGISRVQDKQAERSYPNSLVGLHVFQNDLQTVIINADNGDLPLPRPLDEPVSAPTSFFQDDVVVNRPSTEESASTAASTLTRHPLYRLR